MGQEYFRRPLLSAGGQSQVDDMRVADDLTLAGSLIVPVENLSVSTALQAISETGVTFITVGSSGAGRDFRLPSPSAAGIVKQIFVSNDSTSIDTIIFSNGTANTFWGTTWNQAALAAMSTGSPGGTPDGTVGLSLVSASTSRWAVTAFGSTNWSFSASTGSTGQ